MGSRAELCRIALDAAEEAARLVLEGYRSRPRADEKAKRDLVTEFDLRSQSLLLERLAEKAPGVPVVAEESTEGDQKIDPTRVELAFCVDPLDGTTNFVHGHPFFCVVVGVLERGQPVVGAVVAPALGTSWHGHLDVDGATSVIRRDRLRGEDQPCRVSSASDLGASLIATGFPPNRDHAPDNNFDSFMAVKRRAQAVRRCGSAALDLCLVADGTYDGYWERRLHVWDVAAGSALVRAAGGTVTALDGGPTDWRIGHLIASNGRIHDALVDAVASSS